MTTIDVTVPYAMGRENGRSARVRDRMTAPPTDRLHRRARGSSTSVSSIRAVAALLTRRSALPAGHPGHEELRRQALEAGLPFARRLAQRYAGRGIPAEDLVQVAIIGLIKAVDGFDPERGRDFEAYAAPTINGELKRYFRDESWAVHVPRRVQQTWLDVNACRDELTQRLGRSASAADFAAWLGIPEEEIVQAFLAGRAHHSTSLSAQIADCPDVRVADLLGGVDNEYDLIDFRESLGPALSQLPQRERRIIGMRFFGGMTQAQMAAELGVCQVHVSRLLQRSLRHLRVALDCG